MKLQRNKKLKRLWILYGLLFGIIIMCIGLFVSNAVSTEDYYSFEKLNENLKRENLKSICITDLKNSSGTYEYDIPIVSPNNEDIRLNARINKFDISIATHDKEELNSSDITVALILQWLAVGLLFAIFVCVFIILHSLYKSIKQGKVFQKRNILWLRLIGFFLILMSLSVDFASYFECQYAQTFLVNTTMFPDGVFRIHFTRILFGLLILFVAEIFNIGYDLQEEQDLTV